MTQPLAPGQWSLEGQRSYLMVLAHLQMPRQLRSRFDPDDVVHQTLLQAHRKRDQCRATCEAEFRAWLRAILKNTFAAEFTRLPRQPGGPGPAVSLQELEVSSQRFETHLAAADSTPSERLMRDEELVRLARAIAALPADQQQAVRLHHLDGLSSIEVGRRMGRSKEAVAGLLARGLRKLRDCLREPP